MNIGVLVNLTDSEVASCIKQVHDTGFSVCQLCCWNPALFTQEIADEINTACEKYNVKISAFWCGWSGPAYWNFSDGPHTLGLVPEAFRFVRTQELMCGSDFAKLLNVKNLVTHVGFLPEIPTSGSYYSLISTLRELALHCKNNGQSFLFETGQETPVTLLRTIEDIGLDNLGINLDPANLILYGKANPVDALDVFGKYVLEVHAKDGFYPTDGKDLGKETPIGEGKVNFPALISKLKELGFSGNLIIEREISGEQQLKDIQKAKKLLEELI